MGKFNVQTSYRLFDVEQGNVALKERLGLSRIFVVVLPSSVDIDNALAAFNANAYIEYAEPDYVGFGSITPNDNSFPQQWSLHNTGQSGGEADADIDAPEAWDITVGMSSTVLAIIDSGVDLDHPDLVAKIVPGYDFVNNDNVPQDDHGHGTHVSGIAAANTNNMLGIAGVCWPCRIMPLKALDSSNYGYYTWWASSIVYAVDHGAQAINMSMGGITYSEFLHNAVNYAYHENVPIAAAMMNYGNSTLYYPAAFTETIGVGSTDHNDVRSEFSNFGNHVDLVAPGSSILSTLWDDTYASWSGTSMATPHVVGVIGLILATNQEYTIEELRSTLRTTADDQVGPPEEDPPGWDIYFGAGRLNAAQALSSTIPVQANFIASPVSGSVPLTVVFTNTSSGNYTDELWDFGDGVTNTMTNSFHTYIDPGVYTVSLTVSGPGGMDTENKVDYIRVGDKATYLPLVIAKP